MDRKAKADGTVLAVAPYAVSQDLYRIKARHRRLVMSEHLMAIADELTESLQRDEAEDFTCPRHTRPIDYRPTICPLCALVATRALRPVRRDQWQ